VIVDEEAVLQSDLEAAVSSYRMGMAYSGRDVDESDAELRERILQQLVDNKLILAAAKQEGIEITNEQIASRVQEEVDTAVRRYGSVNRLESELRRNGMSLDDYRKTLSSQLRDRHYIQTIVSSFIRPRIEIRDDEVVTYYNDHIDEVPAIPDSLFLADILIEISSSEDQLQAVRAQLGEVLSRLGQGQSFAQVAGELSKGPSATRGGQVGSITRGDLFSKQLEDVIFSLSEGDISQAVVTERGVHVVKLDKIDGESRTFSQVFLPIEITDDDVARARARADLALQRINNGEPFALVAGEMSADPNSNANGGDLGLFSLDTLSEDIRTPLAEVKAGEMTPPIQTTAGFYIFLVKDRKYGHRLTLKEIRPQVRQALEETKIEDELAKYLDELRDLFVVDKKD
jgi:peptidyl-prolyl cis-trans isomerase SurA